MAINFPDSPSSGDTHTEQNRKWEWNGTYWKIVAAPSFLVSDTPPSNPEVGNIWYESDTGRTFVYYDSTWVEMGHASDAQVFQVSDTLPSSPSANDIWFESDSGKTFIYYDSAWVEIGHASDFGTDQISYNIDGGKAGTVYGGITALNGGSSAS